MTGRRQLHLVALAALGLLAACANPIKKSERPVELTRFEASAKVEQVWKSSVGFSAPRLRLGLSLAVDDTAVYAANHNGEVVAFNKANGRRLWHTATKLELTGGPGVGEGLVVAGASHGKLVGIDAATGDIKWNSYINSELLSAPVIGNGVVVLRTVDGRVAAFKTSDGTEQWSSEQQVPRLSLRGISSPLIAGDQVLVGFDNGRVQALQLSDGSVVWDDNIAPSGGKTELERLNDVDTVMRVRGADLFVVTYQGKAARIEMESGEQTWSRDASSYSGLAVDDSGAYVTTVDGSVEKLTLDGIESWNNKELAWRRLSPPAVLGDLVVVGDVEGYVHFLDRDTGKLAARVHPLSERVSAVPVVSDGIVYVLDSGGGIVALRTAGGAAAGSGTATRAGGEGSEGAARLRPR
jgi:outer membrane protein assembly factor BamB